ncbi:MAG: ABC transporter permease [Candidatus Uhrbacteria bacterium]
MRLIHTFHSAFVALRTNTSRSVLTILGIVIGITAIILVMSIGRGAEALILDQVKEFGPNTISIEPGREPKGPADFSEIFTASLRPRDLDALSRPANVSDLEFISPFLVHVDSVQFGSETYRSQLRGSTEHFPQILEVKLSEGSFFTEDDVARRANVVVIGAKVREEIFGDSDAVGSYVKVSGRRLRVIGVFVEKGSGSFIPYDDLAIMPYTTMQEYILGIDHFHAILAKARDGANIDRVKEDIILTLRESHRITDPEKDDFHVNTMEDAIEMIGVIATVLTALLTSVAAIALVVGGIGIMNIMLVSVTERTREIGLRKALGARRRDILTQFLIESVTLTVVGGIVGVLLGAAFALMTSFVLSRTVATGWTFTFPVAAALLGIGVAAVVGLIFGLYPARQAAKKHPIEALRHE